MSRETLVSRLASCNSLVAGANACAQISARGLGELRGLSPEEIKLRLQVWGACFRPLLGETLFSYIEAIHGHLNPFVHIYTVYTLCCRSAAIPALPDSNSV